MGDKVFGLLASIVTVAMVTSILARGTQAAQVITALGDAFTGSLRVAEGR